MESDDAGDGPNGPRQVHVEGLRNVLDMAPAGAVVVLVSQIYITRPERMPQVREVIEARVEAEALLRASGRRHAIVRPSWLHDGPAGGVRIEQGDRGDGQVSRASVAAACVAAATDPDVDGVTFELYDDSGVLPPDWHRMLTRLDR